jgi:hypothetical protein
VAHLGQQLQNAIAGLGQESFKLLAPQPLQIELGVELFDMLGRFSFLSALQGI